MKHGLAADVLKSMIQKGEPCRYLAHRAQLYVNIVLELCCGFLCVDALILPEMQNGQMVDTDTHIYCNKS